MKSEMQLAVGLALLLAAPSTTRAERLGPAEGGHYDRHVDGSGRPDDRQGVRPAAFGPGAPQVEQRPYDSFVRDLSSTDPDVRARAMRALADSGYPEAIGPLSTLVTDPVDEIQLETIDRILGFYAVQRPQARRMVAGFIEVRSKTSPAQTVFDQGPFVILPRRTPPELVTALSGAMRDQNAKVRLEAVYALGVVAEPPLDPAAAGTLMGGLRDSQTDVRVAAARVLGGLRVGQAGDALIQAVNDPETAVRTAAMRSLGDIREERAIQALTEQFTYYERGPLADAAFDGLSRIGNPATIPLFTSQLTSKNAEWRRLAAEGLARGGDPRAAASVATVLANEKKVPVQLARAFAMQAANLPGLDALVAALASSDTQAQAMGYLVELGPPIAVPLAASLTNPNPQVREGVAMTLGLIGGEPAVNALEPVRRDSDTNVARAAERAIARIRIRGE